MSAAGTEGHANGRLLAGRYRVVEQLGRGGMGMVCRARDEVLGRDVAVKELRTYNDASGKELAALRLRMEREARAAARIRHPGVVAVYDVAEEDGRPVIVMELVDGPSLADVLAERGALDPREAAGIGAKVAEALGAAHAAGVLHRDVKPGNVLLERGGRVVLTDFGIATMEEPGDGAAAQLTQSGELVGSLDFLAPERAQGQQPGPASDIWSLGAMLYAAVEGGSPFRRTSAWSTMTAIVTEPLPEPRRAGELAPVLRELMHKDPQARPDARRAAEMLAALAQGTPATAEPDRTSPAVPPAAQEQTVTLTPRGGQPQPSPQPSSQPSAQPTWSSGQTPPQQWAPAQPPVTDPERPTRPEAGWRPPTGLAAAPRTGPEPAAAAPTGSRPGRRGLIAAAAAAVVVVGAGVTWAMTGNSGSGGSGGQAAQPIVVVQTVSGGADAAPSASGAPSKAAGGHTRTAAPGGAPAATSAAPTAGATRTASGGTKGGTGTTPTTKAPAPTTASPKPWAKCTYYSGTALTQYGDTGNRVREVQCILKARGYDLGAGGVDGDFGADTRAAVKSFQSRNHLTVDGQVGVQTWAALRK